MTNSIRNLSEVRHNLQMLAIKQVLRSVMLKYGVDDLIHGLRDVYRTDVWPRARGLDGVYHRMKLLDETADQITRLETLHENVLRVSEGDQTQ